MIAVTSESRWHARYSPEILSRHDLSTELCGESCYLVDVRRSLTMALRQVKLALFWLDG